MKHFNIGFGALAACACIPALAQSSLTLFGVMDTNIAHGSGAVASKTFVGHSGITGSRLGFRGVEDLGDGLSASFWLEAGVNSDDGRGAATNTNNQASGGAVAGIGGGQGLTFNRRSTVSLAGRGWGEIRIGRDYTQTFWTYAGFDPFGLNGVGMSHLLNVSIGAAVPTIARVSNSVAYHYNSMNATGNPGFYGTVQYFLGENASNAANSKDGTGYAWRAGYESAVFNTSASAARTRFATGDYESLGIGASYKFDVAKVMAQYNRDELKTTPGRTGHGYLVGLVAPMGVGELRASFSVYERSTAGNPRSAKLAAGYVHNLSKRTALYATFARIGNKGGASDVLNGATGAPNASSRGYDAGFRHTF
jgi:predicted porin